MILTCSKCATRYHVDPASLGSDGRMVRCAGCGHRWMAKPPADAPKVLELKTPSTAAWRAAAAARRRSSPPIVAWLIGALLVLVVASAAIGRNEIVARFPESATIYRALRLPLAVPPPGLEFGELKPQRVVEGGVAVLVIEGEIFNQSKEPRHVPPIRVILLDEGGRQLQRETFSSKDAWLDAGGKTTFSGRLVNPPSQARNYSITFDVGS
jgi:predicted Zn finger-like uncharacterized protein